ncbi:NADPH-dependent diflavin oxidoreductase 1 [Vanrija pseudolonga]|uniref:NADPH-dependent diflavin oxidoreductase 1 n=1 Tax=Vanrija pseudolonga TaxID=143232 RepID=A0AAF0Y444_9TREE|nr:NADPH-dependent diflavin oxidoreductase 1 [Vanrija pseudolonga]
MTAPIREDADHVHHGDHVDYADELAPQHVVILYASETGNAQDVAERTARAFRAQHREAVLLSMAEYDIADLPHEALLILITSTHGRGDPPPAMRGLWEKMIRAGLPGDILEDVHYSIFGLGDTSYERFCYAGKMLARRMDSLGAHALTEPGWGDERAPDGLEQDFLPWLERTVAAFLPYLPGPSTPPLPNTALPPPIYGFEDPSDSDVDLSRLAISDKAAVEPFAPEGWLKATIRRNKRVTKDDWWQDVREVDLELQGRVANYPPGSVCSLHPRCSDEEVDEFLEMNGLVEEADKVVVIKSNLPEQDIPPHLPSGPTTLRTLLTHHLDLRQPPRKSMFEWLRRLSADEREQERLDEFLDDPDEIHDYASRPKRTIVETLADFRETKIPLSHVLEVLAPLRRRQFSIASSFEAHPGHVQLLVAMVEYKTNLSIPRRGLCSSWLQSLPEDTTIALEILPPTLFLPKPDVPVILVGPGTGVAPMRAFLEDRVRDGAAKDTALYFGCRSLSSDYYYASEWDEHRATGARVRVAPSRDRPNKVYVQHLLREDAALINEWIVKRGGYVFISGSSNAMPREVREALAWCISTDGAGSLEPEAATEYIAEMFDSGRGGEESW